MMNVDPPLVARMRALVKQWEAKRDRRAIFLTCYSMMTANVLAAIEADEFEDCEWVRLLTDEFAGYYFSALDAYEAGDAATPAIWHFTFDAGRAPFSHVMQTMLLGVNAHICHDLVFALAGRLNDWDRLTEAQRQSRYRDHCRINEVIFRTMNAVQDEVIERYSIVMRLVDDLMGTMDEPMLQRLITEWRDEVWQYATQLLGCVDERQRASVRAQVALNAQLRANAIAGQWGATGLLALF